MYSLFKLWDFQRYFQITIMQISKLYFVNMAQINTFSDIKLIKN